MEFGDGAKVVIRNTFIDAVAEDEEEDGGPGRTVSDQTGLHPKRVLPLGRLSGRPQPITEGRESVITENPPVSEADLRAVAEFCAVDEEEEDDDDVPLTRTCSVAYPAYPLPTGAAGGAGPMAGSPPDPQALQNALNSAGLDAMGAGAMNSWGFNPYMFNGGFGMFPPFPGMTMPAAGSEQKAEECSQEELSAAAAAAAGAAAAAHDLSAAGAVWTPETPALGEGPPIGMLHAFHPETRDMGFVAPDFRTFSKVGYEGRLSVISEKEVHTDGVQRYLVQFSSGELSRADGVGFVFAPRLPCAKNIQRIVSIFVNQRGRICMRIFADIVRASAFVKPLELGDWVEMAIDLDERVATFNIWPRTEMGWPAMGGRPSSTAVFPYGERLGRLNQASHKSVKLNVGHLACVVKNVGVTITLAS